MTDGAATTTPPADAPAAAAASATTTETTAADTSTSTSTSTGAAPTTAGGKQKMRAVVYSGVNSYKWTDSKNKPAGAGELQVIVEVKAAAINPVDYKLAAVALFRPGIGLGLDLAGVICEVGKGVTDFAVGDRVFGNAKGTLADFAKCSVNEIAKIPEGMSFVEAAALPTTYLTAYQGTKNFNFKEGKTLLVIGASGGCGTAAVQLGRKMGGPEARIIGVCSGKNADLVRKLGASEVVDYTSQDLVETVGESSVDNVFDAATSSGAGEDYVKRSKTVLKPDGMYVALNGTPFNWIKTFFGWNEDQFNIILTDHRGKDLDAIVELLGADGRPVIDKVLPFSWEGVQEGFAALKSRRTKGKIVISMEQDAVPQEQEQQQQEQEVALQ